MKFELKAKNEPQTIYFEYVYVFETIYCHRTPMQYEL